MLCRTANMSGFQSLLQLPPGMSVIWRYKLKETLLSLRLLLVRVFDHRDKEETRIPLPTAVGDTHDGGLTRHSH